MDAFIFTEQKEVLKKKNMSSYQKKNWQISESKENDKHQYF